MKSVVLILTFILSIYAQSLESILDYALKNNPTIKQTKNAIKIMQLKKQQSKSKNYGQLDVVASYTHSSYLKTLIPISPSIMKSSDPITESKDIYSSGLSYHVALFTGFAQTEDIDINHLSAKISQIQLSLNKEQLIYNIKSLYLFGLAQQELLNAQKNHTEVLQNLSKEIEQKYKLGKKAKIEYIKALSDLQNSKLQESRYKANINDTKYALFELVTKKVDSFEPIDIKIKKLDINSFDITSLKKLQIKNIDITKSQKILNKTKSSLYPQVVFDAYYGRNYAQDSVRNLWDDEDLWQVALNVKWNIFDFGYTTSTIEKAKIDMLTNSYKKDAKILELKKLIQQTINRANLNYDMYITNKVQLDLAKESAKIEQVRYDSGVITLNDLLLSISKLKTTQANLINNKYQYMTSKYHIDYLLENGAK